MSFEGEIHLINIKYQLQRELCISAFSSFLFCLSARGDSIVIVNKLLIDLLNQNLATGMSSIKIHSAITKYHVNMLLNKNLLKTDIYSRNACKRNSI